MKQLVEQITVDQLDDLKSSGKIRIIDVRDPGGIEQQGSIPTAINIPLDSMDAMLAQRHQDPNTIFNEEDAYLFCCTGGVMSYMGALKAQEAGLTRIYNLEGGHAGWLKWKASQQVR